MTMAEDVMKWAYDLIVLDPYGNFNRKVSETLLDGILGKKIVLLKMLLNAFHFFVLNYSRFDRNFDGIF